MKNTESFLIDTVKTYCNLLHENKPLPAVKQRNENTELVSYNGKVNTIFYNSDILFLSEPLVKTFLAHEVAHWAAGVETQHGPEWVDACTDLEENLGDEIYEIYEHADNYDFESEFYNLEPGKLLNDLKNEFPDAEFKIGFNDYPLEWDDENDLLLITPTFFCADDESLFTEDEKEIIEEQKDYYREESGTMINESIEKTFENILRESLSNYKMIEFVDEKGREGVGIYRSKTHMIKCMGFMIGRNPNIISETELPTTVTEKMIEEFPEYVAIWGGNSTWNYNIYEYIVCNKLGFPVGTQRGDYLVKDFDAIMDFIKSKAIPLQRAEKYRMPAKVGERLFWDEVLWIK